MKKFAVLILSAVMLLSMAACSQQESAQSLPVVLQELEKLIDPENFDHDDRVESEDRDKTEPVRIMPNSIAYINLRTNYAWEQQITGFYINRQGEVFDFDFSKLNYDPNVDFNSWLLDAICDHSERSKPTRSVDVDKINTALGYALKIDPNAKATTKSEMCDYGQRTQFAVVNGNLVMLCSEGDVDKTVEDVNAKKALDSFENALLSVAID